LAAFKKDGVMGVLVFVLVLVNLDVSGALGKNMVVFGRKGGAGLARWRLELWAKPVALLKPSGLCRGCHRVCPKSSIKVRFNHAKHHELWAW